MKKLLLGAILVVGITGVSYASDYTSNFADVESSYNALKAEEAQLVEERKAAAAEAQKTLDEQKRVFAELRQREARMIDGKKTKYYKPEYRALAKQYGTMRKELEAQMAEQQAIIDSYTILVQ